MADYLRLLNVQDQNDYPPLMLAVENPELGTVLHICNYKPNICVVENCGQNALQIAPKTFMTEAEIVRSLLVQLIRNFENVEDDLAYKLAEFEVPLYYVILLKNAEVTKILLEEYNYEYYDVDARDPETGNTPLQLAIKVIDVDNVRVLVEHGANVTIREVFSVDFMFDLMFGNVSQTLEIMKILMDAITKDNQNHWHTEIDECMPILSGGSREVVRLFLSYNIDLRMKHPFDNKTPIHYLASNENHGIFEELNGKDFEVNVTDDAGNTPLHLAIVNPHTVEYLLKRGANVNALTYDGESALFKAISEEDVNKQLLESIEILLQHGAETQTRTSNGDTIIDVVIRHEKYTLIKPVLAHLALMEDTDRESITPYFRERINSNDRFRRRFESYKRLLKRMNEHKLCGVVTLYKLLTASEKEIARYVRNQRLVKKLTRIGRKIEPTSYYTNTLRRRIKKAIRKERLKASATVIMSRIIGINYRASDDIADSIVSYLDDNGIQTLNQSFLLNK